MEEDGEQRPARGNSHWSLLHFDREAAEYVYIDTINGQHGLKMNELCGRSMADNLTRILNFTLQNNQRYGFRVFQAEIQRNSSDCGIYVLSYMHNFLVNGKHDNGTLPESITFVLELLSEQGKSLSPFGKYCHTGPWETRKTNFSRPQCWIASQTLLAMLCCDASFLFYQENIIHLCH